MENDRDELFSQRRIVEAEAGEVPADNAD